MSKFDKNSFNFDGMYLTYGSDRKFVARFKRGGMSHFRSFLIKNFTVEEYFAKCEAKIAPLTILEEKGYLLPHVAKLMKQLGYPATVEGKDLYIKNQILKG